MTNPPVEPDSFLDLVEDFYDGGFRSPRSSRAARAGDDSRNGDDSRAGAAPGAADGPRAALDNLGRRIRACRLCALHENRKRGVPGEGATAPRLLLVGEGPGAEEDRTGRPFVGRAGQYLDKWLGAIGLDRQGDCYITNIVKCRPPGNRDPQPEESDACLPYLERQLALLKPRAICTLGRVSTRILTGRSEGIGALRGRTYLYDNIPLVPTYHPSAVLRNPELRKAVWEDLQRVRAILQDE
jgi:uracil-DNA glycosylase family 4